MMNPLVNKNFDTVWNMYDIVNDLINELKMTKGNFASEIALGLDNSEKSTFILNVLENYDILVLEEVQYYIRKYSESLFNIIQKRRMEYVEGVRRRRRSCCNWARSTKKRIVYTHSSDGDLCVDYDHDNTVDLSRDQDDTANLAFGMEVMYRGIEKINRIIQKKKYLTHQEKLTENLRWWWWGMFSCFVVVFTLAYIITYTFYKI